MIPELIHQLPDDEREAEIEALKKKAFRAICFFAILTVVMLALTVAGISGLLNPLFAAGIITKSGHLWVMGAGVLVGYVTAFAFAYYSQKELALKNNMSQASFGGSDI